MTFSLRHCEPKARQSCTLLVLASGSEAISVDGVASSLSPFALLGASAHPRDDEEGGGCEPPPWLPYVKRSAGYLLSISTTPITSTINTTTMVIIPAVPIPPASCAGAVLTT